MGFFRRSKPKLSMGIPVDVPEYQQQISEGTRPGVPQDGRYWLAMFESNDEEFRLIWEQAATYHEGKSHLKEFERTYGKKPKRLTTTHIDDVAGIWSVKSRGKPSAMLLVYHPIQLNRSFY